MILIVLLINYKYMNLIYIIIQKNNEFPILK